MKKIIVAYKVWSANRHADKLAEKLINAKKNFATVVAK